MKKMTLLVVLLTVGLNLYSPNNKDEIKLMKDSAIYIKYGVVNDYIKKKIINEPITNNLYIFDQENRPLLSIIIAV